MPRNMCPHSICRNERLRAAFHPVFGFGTPGWGVGRFAVGRLGNSEGEGKRAVCPCVLTWALAFDTKIGRESD